MPVARDARSGHAVMGRAGRGCAHRGHDRGDLLGRDEMFSKSTWVHMARPLPGCPGDDMGDEDPLGR